MPHRGFGFGVSHAALRRMGGTVGASYSVSVGPTLPADWSVSRASVGTYFDSGGILQTATSNVGRIAYNPAGGNALRGLLLEPAANELLTRTEELSAWNQQTNIAITTDTILAPDGTLSADEIVATAGSGFHALGYAYGSSLPTPGIVSFFCKKGSTDYLFANFGGGSKNIRTVIDLNAGTMGMPQVTACTLGIYGIIDVGAGWYRCYLQSPDLTPTVACQFTPYNSATVPANAPESHSWTAVGETCYLWGVNIIQASALGSYISASASTAARALETLTISNLNAKGFADGQSYPTTITYEDDTTLDSSKTISSGAISFIGVHSKAIKSFSM
ncbi:MAG: hypothetical protein R3E04_13130 [Sphingobium sp.]